MPTSTAPAASPRLLPPAPTSPRLRVLAVDDCRDNADTLVQILELWGYSALAAYNGPSALEMARRFQPHIILLDLVLPGIDGFQVAAQLHAEALASSRCLIALSGLTTREVLERIRQAGFRRLLVKPVCPTELQDVLIETARECA